MPLDRIRNSFRKRNAFTFSETDLQEIINNFEENFKEWKKIKKLFDFSKENYFESTNAYASAQLMNLKEINKEKIDASISEFRNGLKYNFFSHFWEKKENLKLIQKLKDFLIIEIDNKIIKQNEELLKLEENKIENSKKIKNNEIINFENYFSYFDFLRQKINNNIDDLNGINLNYFLNKKDFLKQLRDLQNKINNKIQELYKKNEELENKNKWIFKDIIKETTITQFISIFWAFRMKNNDNKYELVDISEKNKKEGNKKFLYVFELIDIIFNQYIIYIISNEEKIFDNVFVKYNIQKEDLINEQEKYNDKNIKEIEENTKKFREEIEQENARILNLKNEKEKNKKIIQNFKKRIKDIKNKTKSWLKDLEENQDNQENRILIETTLENRKGKKQYLSEIDKKIKELEKKIEKYNQEIGELEDNIIRYEAEIIINNKNTKKFRENIEKISKKLSQNNYIMMYELNNIKNKWIKNINNNQKTFFNFLKKINNLENTKFIEFIEDYWNDKENQEKILSLNKEFNIEHNIKAISNQKNKELENIEKKLKNINENFKLNELKIIKKLTKSTTEKFKETIKTINQLESINIETQTENNSENSWQDKKIEEQTKKINDLQKELEKENDTNNELQKQFLKIKKEADNELEIIKSKYCKELITLKTLIEDKTKSTEQIHCKLLKIVKNHDLINEMQEEEKNLANFKEFIEKKLNPEIDRLQYLLSEESKILLNPLSFDENKCLEQNKHTTLVCVDINPQPESNQLIF